MDDDFKTGSCEGLVGGLAFPAFELEVSSSYTEHMSIEEVVLEYIIVNI